jgi:hypothetical protein
MGLTDAQTAVVTMGHSEWHGDPGPLISLTLSLLIQHSRTKQLQMELSIRAFLVCQGFLKAFLFTCGV